MEFNKYSSSTHTSSMPLIKQISTIHLRSWIGTPLLQTKTNEYNAIPNPKTSTHQKTLNRRISHQYLQIPTLTISISTSINPKNLVETSILLSSGILLTLSTHILIFWIFSPRSSKKINLQSPPITIKYYFFNFSPLVNHMSVLESWSSSCEVMLRSSW